VRYIGIDAPESQGERLGSEASAANADLVEGRTLYLEKDQSDTDPYGRLLRYVYVGDLCVNAELVRLGFARARAYPPDVKYQELMTRAEADARSAGRGLWAAAPTATPGSASAAACPQGCVTPPPGCLIKGNISKSGERIYHVPAGRSYEQTKIDTAAGERWFCTEAEALANGWRKSKQ